MVECPHCATPNADAAEECSGCGAPLGVGPRPALAPGETLSSPGDARSEGRQPDASPLPAEPTGSEQDDWLAQLLAATADEAGLPPAAGVPTGGRHRPELPIWLRDLAPAEEQADLAPELPPSDAGFADAALPDELAVRETLEEAPPLVPELTEIEDPGLALVLDELAAGDEEEEVSLADYVPIEGEYDFLAGALDWDAATAAELLEGEGLASGAPWMVPGRSAVGNAIGEGVFVPGPVPEGYVAPGVIALPDVGEGGAAAGAADVFLARAQILEELATRASAPRQVVADQARVGAFDRIVRILVPAVLAVTVVLALVAPSDVRRWLPLVRLPAGYPAGPARMHDVLRQVEAGDQMLVAFEYGPAEGDELDLVAAPVIGQLLAQNAYLTIVSTRPDGLVAARGLVGDVVDAMVAAGQISAADAAARTSVAAYRPGDAVGVAHLLQEAGRPDSIVVFAARANPLRWWIEQVHAVADPPPIVAGTSAALEAVASPYLAGDPAQLAGAIVGVSGAAYYDRIANQRVDGPAARRLDALAAGNVAIVVLVIVGAAVSGLQGSQGKSRSSE